MSSPETWTGSRWAVVPRETAPQRPHFCAGQDCASCAAGIEAAEYDDLDWMDHDADMDDRAELEAFRG